MARFLPDFKIQPDSYRNPKFCLKITEGSDKSSDNAYHLREARKVVIFRWAPFLQPALFIFRFPFFIPSFLLIRVSLSLSSVDRRGRGRQTSLNLQ